jgi:succinyl-CoA synthetase beta subunit
LKLYEHEAKSIFSSFAIPTPKGKLSQNSKQAYDSATTLTMPVVVKAQVLVAGRGKAGGILFANTPEEAQKAATHLLETLIHDQRSSSVLVEEKIQIERELYFGVTIDRLNRCYVAVALDTGGVEIEEAAKQQPERVLRKLINPILGFRRFDARQMAKQMGYRDEQMLDLSEIFLKTYRIGNDFDAQLIEMNPLVETDTGNFMAVDTRIILDDNALFRHEEFGKKRMLEKRDLNPLEFEAQKEGIDYVQLNGDIGVIGNGAGLVMATLDMINACGGKPANFLDMGGGAPPQRIEAALRIVLSNPNAKVVLVNILGGITLCDEVARGIIQARQLLKSAKPMAIRLVGTNEEEGRRILSEASIGVFDSMEEAAMKSVELSEKERTYGNNS